ncbi:MAG: ATP-dependent DNA helicase RecG [Bacteroidales bacterium]|nr:ATP-dependent DNA helicase RecG [Bacteroidales bacterium]MBR6265262.1 ATP-dependent DNA helicase RecG [Bacteroidales bacterium]
MSTLYDDIQFLPGVGPKRADLFKTELRIFTLWDLLNFLPFRYIDRSKFFSISELMPTQNAVQVQGRFISKQTSGYGAKAYLKAIFTDGTGRMEVTWFKGIKWIEPAIKPNVDYVLFGKVNEFHGTLSMTHPEMETLQKFREHQQQNFIGVYPATEKTRNANINGKVIRNLVENIFEKIGPNAIAETLPQYILDDFKLPNLETAIRTLHMPTNLSQVSMAQFRIKFEELFWVQLVMASRKQKDAREIQGIPFVRSRDNLLTRFFKEHLPFPLTKAQIRVMSEIRKDVESGKHMNRLIQGDVGSGKTLIAVLSMLMAIDNGYQACLMAPTEILAQQHAKSLQDFLGDLPINIALLTGSTTKKRRAEIAEGLTNGSINMIVGTHALLEDTVQFQNIGLCVIDEQHRFGVAQRAKLWKKNNVMPHVLVMTATPIPRTLAMTLYGDLDVSVIDELPPGRKPIRTTMLRDTQRQKMYDLIKEQIAQGRQIYIVYPLIQESERMDFKNLEDGYKTITTVFPEPKYKTIMVHGKMKPAEKDEAMRQFASGNAQIMVATTVIEVGVNVPNATVMVIESAERFGLSQLHQLRGRVGRGADLSFCVLMAGNKISSDGESRLGAMVQTTDGFQLAEMDMKLRGPGDIEGTQQSGLPITFKLANLAQDGQIINLARNAAFRIIDNDPLLEQPENSRLRKGLLERRVDKVSWRDIS